MTKINIPEIKNHLNKYHELRNILKIERENLEKYTNYLSILDKDLYIKNSINTAIYIKGDNNGSWINSVINDSIDNTIVDLFNDQKLKKLICDVLKPKYEEHVAFYKSAIEKTMKKLEEYEDFDNKFELASIYPN